MTNFYPHEKHKIARKVHENETLFSPIIWLQSIFRDFISNKLNYIKVRRKRIAVKQDRTVDNIEKLHKFIASINVILLTAKPY